MPDIKVDLTDSAAGHPRVLSCGSDLCLPLTREDHRLKILGQPAAQGDCGHYIFLDASLAGKSLSGQLTLASQTNFNFSIL